MFKEAPRTPRGLKALFAFGAARGLVTPDGTERLKCWADEVRGDVAPLGERMADFGAPEACLSSLSVHAYHRLHYFINWSRAVVIVAMKQSD